MVVNKEDMGWYVCRPSNGLGLDPEAAAYLNITCKYHYIFQKKKQVSCLSFQHAHLLWINFEHILKCLRK